MNQERAIFDGGTLWILNADNTSIHVEDDASRKPVRTINASLSGMHILDRFNGFLWACHRENKPEERRLRILSSPDGKTWTDEAYYHPIADRDRLLRAYPLGRDWFFLEYLIPVGMGKETSKWAFAKTDDVKHLKVQKLVDMQLPMPLVKEKPKGKDGWTLEDEVQMTGLEPAFSGIAADFVARYPDGLVLASGHTGFLWIITMKDSGPSTRMVQLFPTVVPVMKKTPGLLEWSILGMQPMPDGSILIASRSEHAVLFARAEDAPLRSLSQCKDALFMSKKERSMLESVRQHPEILWWNLDPGTGAIWKVDPPMNIPSRFESIKQACTFRFRPRLDGNLVAFY